MESGNTTERKTNWKRTLPGIFFSLLALGLVFYFADLKEVIEALKQANYLLLPISLLFFLLSLIARAWAWRTLLQEQVSTTRLFFTINIGYLLNNLFPFKLGEVGRAFFINQTSQVSFWQVASTILIERAFDVMIAVSFLLGSLPFVLASKIGGDSPSWAIPAAITSGGIVLLALVGLHLAARFQQPLIKRLEEWCKPWPKIGHLILGRLESFLLGLTVLTDVSRFIRTLLLLVLSWGLMVIEVFVIMKMFIPDSQWFWVIFSVGVASLGVALPSSPGGIGLLEASYVAALAVFGVDASRALAFAIVSHSLYYVSTITLGVYGLAREGESLGQLYRRIINRT